MSEPAKSLEEPPQKKRRKRTKKASKSASLKAGTVKSGHSNSNHLALAGAFGLFFLTPFLLLTLAHPEWTGSIGRHLTHALFWLCGQASLSLPAFCLAGSLTFLRFRPVKKLNWLWALPLFLSVVLIAARLDHQGGTLGRILDGALLASVGPAGAWLLSSVGLLLSSFVFLGATVQDGVELFHIACARYAERLQQKREEWLASKVVDEETSINETKTQAKTKTKKEEAEPEKKAQEPEPTEEMAEPPLWQEMEAMESYELPEPPPPPEPLADAPPIDSEGKNPSLEGGPVVEDSLELEPIVPDKIVEDGVMEDPTGQLRLFPGPPPQPTATYKLPPLTLLDEAPVSTRRRPNEDKSQALLDALDSFGVKAKLLQIVRGPTVTRYELQPARGVKVSRFTSLTNDIALALASTGVRIEAPIPGKSAIGIEIPNDHNDMVVLKEILSSDSFKRAKGLAVALGKDLSGRPTVTNLQKMPHLLVAGTTGSGKSVSVNGLIISLLYRFTPRQLQLLMVDPKQVELSIYEGVPHLVGFAGQSQGEIIVDPKKAALALHQVVELMEERYSLFAESKVRNLQEYNEKSTDPLPWFVVIIDELADLMMVASKSVETSICRIAQKARAAGIHLVLATQRPSADVITGLIKVNIPSRAAFAVSSQVDSRVILDSGGAEHLLGKGDMLFLPVDASDPRRIQGSFISNEEILRVVEFWKAQGLPDNLIELDVTETQIEESDDKSDDADDALLQEGLRVVLSRKQASASMLQTELKVGYARARRILNAMEKKGWVGPQEGSKPRKILYTGPPPE